MERHVWVDLVQRILQKYAVFAQVIIGDLTLGGLQLLCLE